MTEKDLEAARQAFLLENGDEHVVTLGAIPEWPANVVGGSLRSLVEWGVIDNQQAPMIAWAGLGALAASIPKASLRMGQQIVRASLWLVVVAPVSVGKSVALKSAFGPLQGYEPPVLVTDSTTEALQDAMSEGMSCFYADELSGFLSSMGRYGAGDSKVRDESFFREVWTGCPISRIRKSGGHFYLPDPVLTICGGLQPSMIHKLGSPREGQLNRWMPCVPEFTKLRRNWNPQPIPADWTATIETLHMLRYDRREWTLSDEATEVMQAAGAEWAEQYRDGEFPEHVSGALSKAEDQCMRLTLVLAESWEPGLGGPVPASVVRTAVALTDYAMQSWEALDTPGLPSTLTSSAAKLAEASRQLAEIISSREPGPDGIRSMTRREMQARKVCSMRTPQQIDQLIKAYGEDNPGRVILQRPASGHGQDQIIVLEPERREKH